MARGVPSPRPWLVCAALTLAACSSEPSPQSETPSTQARTATQNRPSNTENACQLLTKADAEAILGSPVEDTTDESRPTPLGDKVLRGFCYYEGDGGSVSLSVNKHIDAAYAAERFAGFKSR